mmetsp:Transcript_25243/g.44152  ORF Transcript_25243/g.44152 Transcript_25243/m.44152 type:complete len:137 (+) Transcript_25243:61-471(+)
MSEGGETNNEKLQVLLTKIMTDRFCSNEARDFDACYQNYVHGIDQGSYVDRSLQRKGLKKCEPYRQAASQCLQDDKKQSIVLKAASQAPTCQAERKTLVACQRKGGQCENELQEMVICGMVYLVQKMRKGKPDETA